MKRKYIFICILLVILGVSSCNYLDIVPDEIVKEEDTFQNESFAKSYLYMCYGAMPRRNDMENSPVWLNSGIEYLGWTKGYANTDYSPSSPLNTNIWAPLWNGIRYCYQFLKVVDKTPGITSESLKYFKAEATFLIAYYHFVSLQYYGPTCIIRDVYDPTIDLSELPERSSYDEVVAFINEKLEEALPNLADKWTGADYGRATKAAVWAIRSRMYLFAASPLFNGNTMYADLTSKLNGRHLISQTYDPDKWKTAAEISKKALEETRKLGHDLYSDEEAEEPSATKPGPIDKAQRRVRYCFMDDRNQCEVLLAETRSDDIYDIQNRSLPRWSVKPLSAITNSIALPLQMVEEFYTKNGLPMEFDKEFDYSNRHLVVDMPVNYDNNNYSTKSNGKTMKMHLNREPRFYAWVGFHNGFCEAAKYDNKVVSTDNTKKVIVLKMKSNDPHGKGLRTGHYSYTGYLSKKYVHPANEGKNVRYPFPVFRMAELYLNYAEALIEMGGDENLKLAKDHIDFVRLRAGIPTVDDAWNKYSTRPGYQNTQEGLRYIVRRERMIEFHLEGNRFWDSRRWITQVKADYKTPRLVLNIEGKTEADFFQIKESGLFLSFNDAQYLMPIPIGEINKLSQIVQNPFY